MPPVMQRTKGRNSLKRKRLDESHNVEHYQNIVFAFSDLIAAHRPLIGDCSMLPHPQKTILYAIEWLMHRYSETMPEEKYDKIRPTLSYLLNSAGPRLARD